MPFSVRALRSAGALRHVFDGARRADQCPYPAPARRQPADTGTAESGGPGRRTRRLSLLVRIASGIQAARGTEEIARQLLERMFEITPAERGAVLLFEAAREEPVFAYTQHRGGAAEGTLHADGKLIAEVRRDGIALLAGGSGDGGATRILAAPVTSLDNTIGIIYLHTDSRASFDEEHLQLATAIGGILGMPLENARRVEWLEAENRRLQEAVNVEHDMVGSGPRMGEIFSSSARLPEAIPRS